MNNKGSIDLAAVCERILAQGELSEHNTRIIQQIQFFIKMRPKLKEMPRSIRLRININKQL